MHTNTLGVIRMVQVCLPLLEKSQDVGAIDICSGIGALDGLTTTALSYCFSKLALNGAKIMLVQALKAKGIAVNSICSGWVRTDMGGNSALRSPQQGADTAIWLATAAPHSQTGKFWRDRQVISF
ncbi:MAG: SDR family NAD(P)-dependent oxidoreductase [Fischerella sp.]|nr:SDR family NAD(P)-dependent oxidoreductase [Fischerella sp.]